MPGLDVTVAVLLATACVGCTGAAVPGDTFGETARKLLAAACAGCTGAAAPADRFGETAGALLAAACAGCTGAAAPIDVAEGPSEGLVAPSPTLDDAGGGMGASTCPCTTWGVPACTSRALRTGAVRSCSSRKSKAEGAIGVVDMSAKGKKDSSKMTCLERMMRFD
jgi:hypothetical protein